MPRPNIRPTEDSTDGILNPSLIVARTELALTPCHSKNLLLSFWKGRKLIFSLGFWTSKIAWTVTPKLCYQECVFWMAWEMRSLIGSLWFNYLRWQRRPLERICLGSPPFKSYYNKTNLLTVARIRHCSSWKMSASASIMRTRSLTRRIWSIFSGCLVPKS